MPKEINAFVASSPELPIILNATAIESITVEIAPAFIRAFSVSRRLMAIRTPPISPIATVIATNDFVASPTSLDAASTTANMPIIIDMAPTAEYKLD